MQERGLTGSPSALAPTDLVLRLLVAAGLGYSAYVHWHLHAGYASNRTSVVSQSDLFVAQAVAAIVAAVAVLLVRPSPRRRAALPFGAWLLALGVAAGSLAVVLVYRYVDVGRVGALPNMYEPVWYALKTRSAFAEALASVASGAGLVLFLAASRRTRTADPSRR